MLPTIHQIIAAYRNGTELGIRADGDGLLQTRAPGTPTTWMDAKVGDWVITPRAGRPSSLNALWYIALCIAADLSRRFGQFDRDAELSVLAVHMKEAFNRRFWNEAEGCLFDVVDDHGNDPSVRPDQILAISLPHAVLDISRHQAVLQKVMGELLTPVGVRTLSPRDPSYQGRYGGSVVARDRAHHQGSAFPWLLGPLVTAYLRINGRGQEARRAALNMLKGCLQYMDDPGMGQICELFDGDASHRPAGAVASARSVAEILRCYVEDVLDLAPGARFGKGGRVPPVKIETTPPRVPERT
jgi:glycogen debranching enzyme